MDMNEKRGGVDRRSERRTERAKIWRVVDDLLKGLFKKKTL